MVDACYGCAILHTWEAIKQTQDKEATQMEIILAGVLVISAATAIMWAIW